MNATVVCCKGWRIAPIVSLLLGILLVPGWAQAEKLYKYRDDAGRLVFTDKSPGGTKPVEVRQINPGRAARKVSLVHRGSKERPVVVAVNDYDGPVELRIQWAEQKNVQSGVAFPARFVLAPRQEKELTRLAPVREDQSWSYRYQWSWVPGAPGAAPSQPAYAAPFCRGSFPVSQGFNGTFSHQDPENRYAVDLVMPVGTPLCAARAGGVMEVANDYYAGGTDRAELMERANFIRILHEDGTMAIYADLMLESVQVLAGQRVSVGQLIGFSGDTGYSSGPHLHFAVQQNLGMAISSIPFTFFNEEPQAGQHISAR